MEMCFRFRYGRSLRYDQSISLPKEQNRVNMSDKTGQNELISVIVPIYNVEEYLPACVESIIKQTYSRLEIILVDDGCTDRSGAICDEYAGKDSRIRVIHQKNRGLSGARNAGLKACHGNYISFIDSDDIIHSQFIEMLYTLCQNHDCPLAVAGIGGIHEEKEVPAGAVTYDLAEKDQGKVRSSRELLDLFYHMDHHNNITVAWNKLYRRDVIGDFLYPEGFVYEDEATTFAYIYRAQNTVWTDAPLYYYRQRPGSITQQKFSLKRLDVLEAYKRRRAFYLEQQEEDYALREEYCQLSAYLNFYALVKKHLPQERETLRQLRQDYGKLYHTYDHSRWSPKRRFFYGISLLAPGLYGRLKGR